MQHRVIIHCKGKELDILLQLLEDLGYVWNGDGVKPTTLDTTIGNYIYLYNENGRKLIRYGNSCPDEPYVEFSTCENLMATITGMPI